MAVGSALGLGQAFGPGAVRERFGQGGPGRPGALRIVGGFPELNEVQERLGPGRGLPVVDEVDGQKCNQGIVRVTAGSLAGAQGGEGGCEESIVGRIRSGDQVADGGRGLIGLANRRQAAGKP